MNRLISIAAIAIFFATSSLVHAQQAKPRTKVLQPEAGQTLTGKVDVRVKLPSAQPLVYVGLGGPPWVKLEQVGDTNEWVGQLDSTMVPNGRQRLIVKTTNKRAGATLAVTVKNPLKIFFSDLHAHTGFSDGTLLPRPAYDYARNTAKLDVFSLTDHLESIDDTEWLELREAAWDANQDGEFVAIPGLEWTKSAGHINIFDPKVRYWPKRLADFYKAAADAGVICKFNHPGNGTKHHGALAYSVNGDKAVQLMEVRSANEEKAYIRALKLGWHIAPDGSDDTHGANWGTRRAWSGILAPGLSQRNILDALKKRHCYSTLDRNCKLAFVVNGTTMGEIIAEPVSAVAIVIEVADPDAGDSIAKVELFEDGKAVDATESNLPVARLAITRKPKPGKHVYFAKVTQKDGNMLWSAPVWVTVK